MSYVSGPACGMPQWKPKTKSRRIRVQFNCLTAPQKTLTAWMRCLAAEAVFAQLAFGHNGMQMPKDMDELQLDCLHIQSYTDGC